MKCRLLIDAIEKSLKRTSGEKLCESLYMGRVVNTIRCCTCGYTSEREESFYDCNMQVIGCPSECVSTSNHRANSNSKLTTFFYMLDRSGWLSATVLCSGDVRRRLCVPMRCMQEETSGIEVHCSALCTADPHLLLQQVRQVLALSVPHSLS